MTRSLEHTCIMNQEFYSKAIKSPSWCSMNCLSNSLIYMIDRLAFCNVAYFPSPFFFACRWTDIFELFCRHALKGFKVMNLGTNIAQDNILIIGHALTNVYVPLSGILNNVSHDLLSLYSMLNHNPSIQVAPKLFAKLKW